MRLRVEELRYLLIANGAPDSPPASGVREWLKRRGAEVTMVVHPLGPEEGGVHAILRDHPDGSVSEHRVRLPSRPPLTYPLDLLVPPVLPRADVVLAFNNLHAARAIAARRPRRVIYWAVDYVPDRFGRGSRLTRAYEALDGWVCRHADARFEVSRNALEARAEAVGGDGPLAPAHVVPIGTWVDRLPVVPDDAHGRRRVVFIGHLVERMGIDTFIDALTLLRDRGIAVTADIAGRGPLEEPLRARAAAAGLADRVTWHGFIADHRRLEALLAEASMAVAPYSTRVESFTRFADPSKLKSYLGAGLPILLTDVPPNAHELQAEAGAEIVADSAQALAAGIERLIDDERAWRERREAALRYVRQFDWDVVLSRAVASLGLE